MVHENGKNNPIYVFLFIHVDEGDSCFSTILLGAPSTAECMAGTHCDRTTLKCVRGE